MKKLFITVIAAFVALSAFSQDVTNDITGTWNGVLKVQSIQLRLVFNIQPSGTEYKATMDSPDQGAKGIPVAAVSFENGVLKLSMGNIGAEYEGVLKDTVITGTFKQMGQSFPLNLTKGKAEKEKMIRPQEPEKPYPYYEEEVIFENPAAGIKLAGTLALPQREGHFPAVILISGSGPQNRDEELMGHKPFLVLSDYLTKQGIAVLRFDDRGTAASTGNFSIATTADFATDVAAGIKYLQTRKEINQKKIGLIGHSEGGIIAPMLAAQSQDVAFIVLLAGPGVSGGKILIMQQELIAKASGVSDEQWAQADRNNRGALEIVKKSIQTTQLKIDLEAFLEKNMLPAAQIQASVTQLSSPWMQYFIKYDPVPALEKVKCPVLALNGEKDLQVPAKENLEAIKAALEKGGNKKFTLKELPGLNHLFQECKTGLPAEYAGIEQTFSPIALNEIWQWIEQQVK